MKTYTAEEVRDMIRDYWGEGSPALESNVRDDDHFDYERGVRDGVAQILAIFPLPEQPKQPAGTFEDPVIHYGDESLGLLRVGTEVKITDPCLEGSPLTLPFRAYAPKVEGYPCEYLAGSDVWESFMCEINGKWHKWLSEKLQVPELDSKFLQRVLVEFDENSHRK